MASSIAMRACPAPCHATRAGRHAGASRRPTSSASSVSVVARAVNAGETSGKATEDGKPVPPALTSEVRVDATEAVNRLDDAVLHGRVIVLHEDCGLPQSNATEAENGEGAAGANGGEAPVPDARTLQLARHCLLYTSPSPRDS